MTEVLPEPESTPILLPPNTHQVCGGGRANAFQCQKVTLVSLTPISQAAVPHVMVWVFVSRIRYVAGSQALRARTKTKCVLMIPEMTVCQCKEKIVQVCVLHHIEV